MKNVSSSLYLFVWTTLGSITLAQATPAPMTIKEAAKTCEADVTKYCMGTTCSQYCEAKFKNIRTSKEQKIAACKGQCTADARCKLKPLGGSDDPQNAELDAQNRDQLIACIAQMRDPEGTKSGRRMEDWKTLQTPSWKKMMTP